MPNVIVVHVVDAARPVAMNPEPTAVMTKTPMMAAKMVAAVCASQLGTHEADYEGSRQNQEYASPIHSRPPSTEVATSMAVMWRLAKLRHPSQNRRH